jgi:hypothetical protein
LNTLLTSKSPKVEWFWAFTYNKINTFK